MEHQEPLLNSYIRAYTSFPVDTEKDPDALAVAVKESLLELISALTGTLLDEETFKQRQIFAGIMDIEAHIKGKSETGNQSGTLLDMNGNVIDPSDKGPIN